MIEKEPKKMLGVDESAIFKCLWSKKVFIISVTLLCLIAGCVYIRYFRTTNYLVSSVMKFTEVESDYVTKLFEFGKVDLPRYNSSGKIESADSLHLSPENKQLLSRLKNQLSIGLDYVNSHIVIKGETVDTTTLKTEVTEVALFLQKAMYGLSKAYLVRNLDSLHLEQDKVKEELQDSIKHFLLSVDDINASSPIDDRVEAIYIEYYNKYFVSSKLNEIAALQKYINMFKEVEICVIKPHVEVVAHKLDNRPLLMRWVFFGFAGSCVGVLLLSLLAKKRD